MPLDYSLYNTLLQGIQFSDPRLYDLLKVLVDGIVEVNKEIFPAEKIIPEEEVVITSVTPDVTFFSFNIQPESLLLYWNSPDDTRFFSYEIRQGNTWEFGNRILITPSLSADFPPILTGTYKYWIKAISLDGGYSINPKELDVVIPEIGLISITSQVVDNNVLLFWTEPIAPFRIQTYEIYKGDTLLGTSSGTFEAIFEVAAGGYNYKIRALDIAGSYGPFSTLLVIVSTPPDYVLQDQRESDFLGSRINVFRESVIPSIIFNANIDETWEEHFLTNGFASPADQIAAGYPYYAQPTESTGKYTEVIDYGIVITGILVNIDYVREVIVGSGHDLAFVLSNSIVSGTGPWIASLPGTNVFFTEVRWLKIEITATALD